MPAFKTHRPGEETVNIWQCVYDCECSLPCYHCNIIANPNHLQARTTTFNIAKQIAELEKQSSESETFMPLNDHSLFEVDGSKHLKDMVCADIMQVSL